MSKKAVRHKSELPPCPDPARYILVSTKEGFYWRRKRGELTDVRVNSVLSVNKTAYKTLMPAVARLMRKLAPYTHDLKMGRIGVRMAGKLLKPFVAGKKLSYAALENTDLQPEHLFDKLCTAPYYTSAGNGVFDISIELDRMPLQPQSKLATAFYFTIVLLYGDATKDDQLITNEVVSPLYGYGKMTDEAVRLAIPAAPVGEPYLLCLKISSLEGNELAMHPRHYGMKVVKAG